MIHRMALMKMNEGFDASVIEMMQTHVATIRETVNEVQSYELIPNVAAGNQGYGWIVLSSFENEADMEHYRTHPLHQAFIAAADPYTEDFIAIAYERS